MPGMNGGDVTKILRQEHYSGRIVGLTGNTMSEQRDAYMQCGIDSSVCVHQTGLNGLLAKPITMLDLNNYLLQFRSWLCFF